MYLIIYAFGLMICCGIAKGERLPFSGINLAHIVLLWPVYLGDRIGRHISKNVEK